MLNVPLLYLKISFDVYNYSDKAKWSEIKQVSDITNNVANISFGGYMMYHENKINFCTNEFLF